MLKNRVAIGAAIQISKYKDGLSKMHKINYLKNLLADSDRVTAALDGVKPIRTNYLKDLLADSDRVTAALDGVKPIRTNYLKDLLADSDRVTAALDGVKPIRTNYLKDLLADSDRVTAALDGVKPIRTNYLKDLLADSDRVTAALDGVKPIRTNYLKDLLADSDRVTAALDGVKPIRTNYLKDLLADSDRVTAALNRAKPLRGNCVETYYNRDLAYRGEEETNHATEGYNEEVKLNLELEKKSIFGDGLAFSVANKEISSNITFNIGPIIQGGNIEMKFEISDSQVGVLNTGKMQAKSITTGISTLTDSNQYQIAEALKSLTEAVKASQDISSQQRTEILEQLEILSTQATLAPTERKAGLIKPILLALSTALSAGGGLAEIWSTWGNMIESFFDIHG